MSNSVQLASLGSGVLQDDSGNVIVNRPVNVYQRDTTTPVQVYSDEALTITLAQPIRSDTDGQLPGYVAPGSIDLVDLVTGIRRHAEAVSATQLPNLVAGASAYLAPSGGDDSTALQNALANYAPFASPLIVMAPGTYLWNTTVPAVPRNTVVKIVAAGIGRTIVRGSAAAPRFLDMPYVADNDVYSNFWLEGVSFDRQNITQATNTHILVGNLIGGAWSLRSNFSNVTIKNCSTLNVPTGTPGNGGPNYQNVSFASRHLASGEATQSTLTNFLVQDCDFANGGNCGVIVMGTGATPVNVKYDNIRIIRVRHDTQNTPTGFHGDSCFQIGGTGFGGTVYMEECSGRGSGDVGTEIDDPIMSTMVNCRMTDCWNAGLFPNNFGGQTDIAGQVFKYTNCLTQKINLGTGATTSNGFRLGGTGGVNTQLGRVVIEDYTHENFSQSLVPGDALAVSSTNPTAGYKVLVIRGMKVSISGYNQNVTTLMRIGAVQTAAPAGTTLIEHIEDLDVNFNVTRGAGSTASMFIHAYSCRGTGTIVHNVDGLTGSLTENNAIGTSTQLVSFGLDTDAGIHRGTFRRVGPHSTVGDSSPIALRFGPGNTYGTLEIMDSDLSGAAAGNEFNFASAGDSAKVRCTRVRRRNGVTPTPTTLTGLTTATGKALGTIHSCTVQVAPATGTGVSVIDYSTDGGTSYTQVLNQTAGPTPAGAAISFGPLTTDSVIRVAFTGTQPTINLVPYEP